MVGSTSGVGGLESVQARIASIQARIAELNRPPQSLGSGPAAAATSASRLSTATGTTPGSFDNALASALSTPSGNASGVSSTSTLVHHAGAAGPGAAPPVLWTAAAAASAAATPPAVGRATAQPASAPAPPSSPAAAPAPVSRPSAPEADSPARTTEWVAPVTGRISSRYGPRGDEHHTGLDIAVPTGTAVRSASGGVVRFAGWKGGYGNAVIVDHPNGISTLYAHNSALLVEPGERVRPGETIAKSGSTGRSTGPHLHFEVRVADRAVDPLDYLRDRGVRV